MAARQGHTDELPGISVRWSAPAGCPDADALRERIRQLLPAPPSATSPARRLLAEGAVDWVDGQYRLRLGVAREGESTRITRVFQADSCESVTGAAAVTLALLARGGREPPSDGVAPAPPSSAPSSRGTAPSPDLPIAPSAPASTAPTSPPAPSSVPSAPSPPPGSSPTIDPVATRGGRETTEPAPRSAERSWSLAVDAPRLTLDQGVLPTWAYGLGAGIGVYARRIRVMATGTLWLPQDAPGGTAYGGRYQRRSGELAGCYAWLAGSFDVGPCATLTLEDVTGHGNGPEVVGSDGHATWLTVGVGARVGWSLGTWASLFVRPTLALTTSRPTFAIDFVGPLYQVPWVSAGVNIGCAWIL